MRLGYLYSRYPVISQTFCDREMIALERLGFGLEIGSVHAPLTSLRHEVKETRDAVYWLAVAQSSWAWRMAAPFRAARRVLRRGT